MNNETLLVAFVGLTGFAMLVQAIVMLVAFMTMRKTIVSLQSDVQEMRTSVMPILTRSKETIDKIAPKIESIASDMADLAQRAREQGIEVQATATDIMDRIQRQTSRVDTMFTGLIDSVEYASNVVADSVTRPMRQISALLASAKAFLSVLATGRRPGQPAEVVQDQDMFV
jgi:methyl-accepting chemotaxis protein